MGNTARQTEGAGQPDAGPPLYCIGRRGELQIAMTVSPSLCSTSCVCEMRRGNEEEEPNYAGDLRAKAKEAYGVSRKLSGPDKKKWQQWDKKNTNHGT